MWPFAYYPNRLGAVVCKKHICRRNEKIWSLETLLRLCLRATHEAYTRGVSEAVRILAREAPHATMYAVARPRRARPSRFSLSPPASTPS